MIAGLVSLWRSYSQLGNSRYQISFPLPSLLLPYITLILKKESQILLNFWEDIMDPLCVGRNWCFETQVKDLAEVPYITRQVNWISHLRKSTQFMACLTHYSIWIQTRNLNPHHSQAENEKKHLEVDTYLDYFFQVWLNKYKTNWVCFQVQLTPKWRCWQESLSRDLGNPSSNSQHCQG